MAKIWFLKWHMFTVSTWYQTTNYKHTFYVLCNQIVKRDSKSVLPYIWIKCTHFFYLFFFISYTYNCFVCFSVFISQSSQRSKLSKILAVLILFFEYLVFFFHFRWLSTFAFIPLLVYSNSVCNFPYFKALLSVKPVLYLLTTE